MSELVLESEVKKKKLQRLKIILIFTLLILVTFISIVIVINSREKKESDQDLNDMNDNVEQIENVPSYPVSYTYDNPDTLTDNPEYQGIKWVTSFAPYLEELPFSDPNGTEVNLMIRVYYSNLLSKNFEEAFKFGAQGRSFENFVNLYKDIDYIRTEYIKSLGDNKYSLEVILGQENTEIETYDVTLIVKQDVSGNYYIESSTSTKVDKTYDLYCLEHVYNYLNPKEVRSYCTFVDQNNKGTGWISTARGDYDGAIPLGRVIGDNVYLAEGGGAASGVSNIIFVYNKTNKSLNYLKEIGHIAAVPCFTKGKCTPEELECNKVFNDSNATNIYESGCIVDYYKDTEWFHENAEYVRDYEKYLKMDKIILD